MKAILLLSGGFDSPVSGMLAKNKGIELIALHFSLEPFGSNESFFRSKELAKKIGVEKFYCLKAGKFFSELVVKCNPKFYFILSKRFMFKVAELLAVKEHAQAIISGENLGQVSSQTLHSMSVITQAISFPILRPVLAFDKEEIISLSRKFNFFELSSGPECCDAFGSKKPITHPKLEDVLLEEKALPTNFIQKAFQGVEQIKQCDEL